MPGAMIPAQLQTGCRVDESLPQRRFYATDTGPCPYLPGREERRLVTMLDGSSPDPAFDTLTAAGFRRSQRFLYKPACPSCRACVPVRILVAQFRPGRNFRKVLKANADITVSERLPATTNEHYVLFRRYLNARHAAGGMVQMGPSEFAEMVEQSAPDTRLIELRDGSGTLVGVSLTDYVASGLSGVYKFFAPEAANRSLGTFIILWHIQRAGELDLPYVYLGYWISACRKMAYKSRFQPMERLEGWRWVPFDMAGEPERVRELEPATGRE